MKVYVLAQAGDTIHAIGPIDDVGDHVSKIKDECEGIGWHETATAYPLSVADFKRKAAAKRAEAPPLSKPRLPINRSIAHAALMEVPEFRALTGDDDTRAITAFLNDWYDVPDKDMGAYAKKWGREYFQ